MSPVLSTFSGASARAFGFGYALNISDFEHISTQTVGAGGAASVTFSSIPSTYKHLQIRWTARSTRSATGDNIVFRFNSDSGANYTYHQLQGFGTGVSSNNGTSMTGALSSLAAAANSGSNIFGVGVSDILDYANTSKNKVVRSLGGWDQNNTVDSNVSLRSSMWINTSAINTILVYAEIANLAQYSTFSLYGVK